MDNNNEKRSNAKEVAVLNTGASCLLLRSEYSDVFNDLEDAVEAYVPINAPGYDRMREFLRTLTYQKENFKIGGGVQ